MHCVKPFLFSMEITPREKKADRCAPILRNLLCGPFDYPGLILDRCGASDRHLQRIRRKEGTASSAGAVSVAAGLPFFDPAALLLHRSHFPVAARAGG